MTATEAAAPHLDVIATTISGSIQDWKKVERIVPLFREHGFTDVNLVAVGSHREAREEARAALARGGRVLISAGGSGTFRHVLEGCMDSGTPLDRIRLGFLRKGSADLIGKTLGMPDAIEEAIAVFAEAIRRDVTVPCDVLLAESTAGGAPPMHFVGYGGAEIFGRIPHFTENRFMKWYKGVLGALFGDLGPFTLGMSLAAADRWLRGPFGGRGVWRVGVDGALAAEGRYQVFIIVNGYLGADLPFASDPLGSGHFHLFGLRDMGWAKLPLQVFRARTRAIAADPARWGMESYIIRDRLELTPSKPGPFPVNVDGSTLMCEKGFRARRVGRIPLLARSGQ